MASPVKAAAWIFALLALACASCSSPATKVKVAFTSEPTGATVLLDGEPRGPTPLELELPVSSVERAVVLKLEGHVEKTATFVADAPKTIRLALEKTAPADKLNLPNGSE
jgi:hypothetical protein